jgi:hypothetical protein
MGVEQQHVVTLTLEKRTGVAELEWKVGLAAAEVNAAIEGPSRVDQRKFHEATRLPTTSCAGAAP